MKRRVILALLGLLAVLGLGLRHLLRTPLGERVVVFAPAVAECGEGPGRRPGAEARPFRYCVHRAPGSAAPGLEGRRRLVYHLHGRNLDELAWNDPTYYPSMIQRAWQLAGTPPPLVATVSFGGTWLLAARSEPPEAAPESGLLEVFRDEVLPTIEARTGPIEDRVLLGESMGGVNALAAGLALPGRFRRIVALCPPLFPETPFDGLAAVRAGLERTGAEPARVLALRMLGPDYFADAAAYRAFNPLDQVDRAPEPGTPELYVSGALYDAFGAYDGVEALAERARARGYTVENRPLYGGHCAVDIRSVAEALVAP